MRMPWVQCSSSLDQYCIQRLIKATTMYHQLYMISSCIMEHRSDYYFDIVTSMGIPALSIYMSHIIVSHPFMGTILIQKPKATMPQPRKHHLSAENPMMSVRHTMSSCPDTSGGNLFTQKISHLALHGLHHPRTPMHDPHLTPFDPHTLKRA